MINQKQPQNLKYFKHLGCLITSYERRLSEIERRNAVTTAEFKKKEKGEIFARKFKVFRMYSFGYFPGVRLWFADVSEPSISSIFKGWM